MSDDSDMPVVLVVEDDEEIREAIREALDDRCRVVAASNGRSALARLAGGIRPAAILLDLVMPMMDGYDLLAALERDEALSRIPVIIMTASLGLDAERLGDRRVLKKPVSLATFRAALRSVGGLRRGD